MDDADENHVAAFEVHRMIRRAEKAAEQQQQSKPSVLPNVAAAGSQQQ